VDLCHVALVIAVPVEGAHPLDRLAGVPLVLRAVLSLQQEGITRIWLLIDENDRATGKAVKASRRVSAEVEILPCASVTKSLAGLADRLEPRLILTRHDLLVDPLAIRALRAARPEQALGVAASSNGARLGPVLARPALIAALGRRDGPAPGPWEASMEAHLDELVQRGGLVLLQVAAAWHARAGTEAGRALATEAFFALGHKPVDGIVARRINRPISLWLTRRLIDVPVTPNMVTVVSFSVGILAALAAGRGGYGYTLAGAFLLQCNSILDGVDGELARIRLQKSKIGEWLDTVTDDASNLLFYAGLATGAESLPYWRELVWSARIAIVASLATMALYYTELARLGSGDFYALEWAEPPPGMRGKVVLVLRSVLKRDFFIFAFLCLAVLGVLPYALPLVALGALVTCGAAIHRRLTRRQT
jgi:phosphatidylglycerophosphate synthase